MLDALRFFLLLALLALAFGGIWIALGPNGRQKVRDFVVARKREWDQEAARKAEYLRVLEPIFTRAYALHAAGELSPESLLREARERGDDYVRREAEITRAYNYQNSPIRDQASCAKAAAFLKNHAASNPAIGFKYNPDSSGDPFDFLANERWEMGIRDREKRSPTPEEVAEHRRSREAERYRAAYRAHHGVDPPEEYLNDPRRRPGLSEREIASILYNYHCRDWNVLKLAKGDVFGPEETPTTLDTPGDQFARLRIETSEGYDRGVRRILASKKDRLGAIEADESLSREEKEREVERIREDIEHQLLDLRRKMGRA